jgi:hypothetical protein
VSVDMLLPDGDPVIPDAVPVVPGPVLMPDPLPPTAPPPAAPLLAPAAPPPAAPPPAPPAPPPPPPPPAAKAIEVLRASALAKAIVAIFMILFLEVSINLNLDLSFAFLGTRRPVSHPRYTLRFWELYRRGYRVWVPSRGQPSGDSLRGRYGVDGADHFIDQSPPPNTLLDLRARNVSADHQAGINMRTFQFYDLHRDLREGAIVEIPMDWDIGRSIGQNARSPLGTKRPSWARSLIQARQETENFRPSRVARSSDRSCRDPAQTSRG